VIIRFSRCVRRVAGCGPLAEQNLFRAAAKMIDDAAPRDLPQPRFKRAEARVVFELRQFARHGDDGLLHDVLSFAVAEPGFSRNVVDEPAVGVEENAPAFLIVPGSESAEQALACRNEFVRAISHDISFGIFAVIRGVLSNFFQRRNGLPGMLIGND
jgi:hypothetical protein